MIDRFSVTVAFRNLRYHLGQTLLSIGVVATSVTLIIFLTALISGLQKRLISSVTGSIPHVVVRQPERVPISLEALVREGIAWGSSSTATASTGAEPLYMGKTVRLEARKRKIEDWAVWLARFSDFDREILAVSPVVEDQAIVSRGARRQAVVVTGVIPERHNRVVDLQAKLVEGRFFGLNAGEVVLGYKLAEDFSLQTGDKIRVLTSDGVAQSYSVAGIFDTGFKQVDSGTIFVSLRDAQSLFGLGMAVTSIGIKLERIFAADDIAQKLAGACPYETVSWMRDNQTLLSGLRAQSSSSAMILGFTAIAAGFGIAAILIMSVVGKLREIGILKAMGATNRQITAVFVLQGTLLAVIGGLVGSGLGGGLCLFLLRFKTTVSATGRMVETFPMDLSPQVIVTAIGLAVVVGFFAALYPSWRAASVDPIAVIRGA